MLEAQGGIGHVEIGANSIAQIGDALQVWEGSTIDVSDGGIVEVGKNVLGINSESGAISIRNGGMLTGNGSVIGNVIATGGTIAPGTSPGILSVGGMLSLGVDVDLVMEIAGNTTGMYDQLHAIEGVTLGGNLVIDFINNFMPSELDDFVLINGNSTTGTFTSVEIHGLPTDVSYELFVDEQQVVLRNVIAVPEPKSISIVLICLGLIRISLRDWLRGQQQRFSEAVT